MHPFTDVLEKGEWLGRKPLRARLEQVLADAQHGRGHTIALEGVRGSGRSYALKKTLQQAGRAGMAALYVQVRKGDNKRSITRKLAEQWRESGRPRIRKLSAFFGEPVILALDDLPAMRKWQKLLEEVMQYAQNRPGMILVSGAGINIPGVERMEVTPLRKEEVTRFIEKTLEGSKVKMGNECLYLILRDSGGNPCVLEEMLRTVYAQLGKEEKFVSKAHYLRAQREVLDRCAALFEELYYITSGKERKMLRAMAKGEAIAISELAKKLRMPLNSASTLALRLLKKGSLVRVERGRYRIFNPLYGRYILQRL